MGGDQEQARERGKAPLISVIIPVYNVGDYLALSLQSVSDQTLGDIEMVCVNDGSTDSSAKLLARAAQKDPRIRIVTKPNGGLSSARNAGIDAARGRYLCFLDSDDMMLPEACETIATTFAATGADVVTYGAEVYPPFWATHWTKTILSPRDALYVGFDANVLFHENSHPFVWRTACNREFLLHTGLRFDETLPFGEDQVFHFQLYPRSKRTALISQKLVQYRVVRAGSLMNQRSVNPFQRTSDHIEIVSRILADWDNNGFLAKNAQAMFDWIMEFVSLDVISAEGKDRVALMDQFREVLNDRFDEAFLAAQTTHRLHGYIAEELYGVDTAAYEGKPEELKQRYYDALFGPPPPEPQPSVRQRAENYAHDLLRQSGISADYDEARQEEYLFELRDRIHRRRATARLIPPVLRDKEAQENE